MHADQGHEDMFQRALSLDAAEQTDEAVRTMQPLIEARDNPRYLLAYAFFMSRVNRDDEAIQAIRDALTITPAYCEGEARLLLADLLLRSGAKGDAIAQWRIVATMKPAATGFGAVPDEAIVRLKQHDV